MRYFSTLTLILLFLTQPSIAQTSAKDKTAESTNSLNSFPKAKTKTPLLRGRIEQLVTQSGATLPIQPQSQSAKLDSLTNHNSLSTSIGAFGTAVRFPQEWSGYWNGELTVHSIQFSPACWQVDKIETQKQQELFSPGRIGQVSFVFSRSNGQLCLEPAQVIFNATLSKGAESDQLNHLLKAMGMSSQSNSSMDQLLNNMPSIYILHLGDLENGMGLSGNPINNHVLKNDVHQIAEGIIEQDLISHISQKDTNGRNRYSYSEVALRFYRQTSDSLYVQVASVNYFANGTFKNKILLYGTVKKASAPQQLPMNMDDALKTILQNLPPSQ